jgi:tetratricopeptide (TPR) repeat protein
MDATTRAGRLKRLERLSRRPLTALTIRTAREFLDDYPDDERGWTILGRALSDANRCAEAEEAFTRAIECARPQRLAEGYARLGHLSERCGKLAEAATWYGRAVKEAADDATYHLSMGWLLARQGRLREAEVCFRVGTECDRGAVEEALYSLGLVLRSQERFAEAAECFRAVLRADPSYREARWALRDVERCAGIVEGAG